MDHWDLFSSKMKSYDNLTLRFITGFGPTWHFCFWCSISRQHAPPSKSSFYDRAVSSVLEDRDFNQTTCTAGTTFGSDGRFLRIMNAFGVSPLCGEGWSCKVADATSCWRRRCCCCGFGAPPIQPWRAPLSEVVEFWGCFLFKAKLKLFASGQNTKKFTLIFPVPYQYIFGTRGRSLARLAVWTWRSVN